MLLQVTKSGVLCMILKVNNSVLCVSCYYCQDPWSSGRITQKGRWNWRSSLTGRASYTISSFWRVLWLARRHTGRDAHLSTGDSLVEMTMLWHTHHWIDSNKSPIRAPWFFATHCTLLSLHCMISYLILWMKNQLKRCHFKDTVEVQVASYVTLYCIRSCKVASRMFQHLHLRTFLVPLNLTRVSPLLELLKLLYIFDVLKQMVWAEFLEPNDINSLLWT